MRHRNATKKAAALGVRHTPTLSPEAHALVAAGNRRNGGRSQRRVGAPELEEQKRVAKALRLAGLRFNAQNNGAWLSKAQAGKAKAAGVEQGAPDVVIFTPPPAHPERRGTVLEMKAPGVGTGARNRFAGCSAEQVEYLTDLEAIGWHVLVGFGADDALQKLAAAGYPVEAP